MSSIGNVRTLIFRVEAVLYTTIGRLVSMVLKNSIATKLTSPVYSSALLSVTFNL